MFQCEFKKIVKRLIYGGRLLERAQYLEAAVFMSGYLLAAQGDRVAMAHSVEGRYPFLDHRVVEFCSRLPSRLKLRTLQEKWLLRQVAKDWLPSGISNRRKRPYRAPIHRCFADSTSSDSLHELVSASALEAAGVFKCAAVNQLMARLREGKPMSETDDMTLVGVISTQLLYSRFIRDHPSGNALGPEDDVKVVKRRALAGTIR